MIIDCHTHITEDGRWFSTSYPASLDDLLRQMDTSGVDKSVILPIYPHISNQFIATISSRHRDRLIGFGTMGLKTWKEDLQDILTYRLKGVKFHPRLQNENIFLWDEAGILTELEKSGLPLLVCGWQQTSAQNADMSKIEPLSYDLIAKKYPGLKIILAHLGGHKMWDAFFCARGNANVYLDCSYFFEFFKGTSLESDFWTIYPKINEKILYGSDFPEVSIVNAVSYLTEKLQQLGQDKDKLFFKNLAKIVDIYE